MKICFIATGIVPPWNNGIKNIILDLSINLARYDIEITVVTSSPSSDCHGQNVIFINDNIRIYISPYNIPHLNNQTFRGCLSGLYILKALTKLIKGEEFDVIHSHSASPLLAFPAYVSKDLFEIPTLHTLHALPASRIGQCTRTYRILRKFDKVSVTLRMYKEVLEKVLVDTQCALIPEGVSTHTFYPLSKKTKEEVYERLNITPPVVGYIGPLTDLKGFDRFLKISNDIINEISDITFLIVNSNLPSNYAYLTKEPNYKLTGYIKSKELKNEIINIMDVVVLPYPTLKTTIFPPLAVLESMSCAKPVITTNVTGMNEVIYHNWNGIITNSDKEIKNSIIDLIFSKKRRKKIGRNARKLVETKYNITKIAKQYIKIYKEVT
jgi:glycosyltransferase involved in cell wall biosynthesis